MTLSIGELSGGMRYERSFNPRRPGPARPQHPQNMGGLGRNFFDRKKKTGRGGPPLAPVILPVGNPEVYMTNDPCASNQDGRAPSNASMLRSLQSKVFDADEVLNKALAEVDRLVAGADKLAQLAPNSEEADTAQGELADSRRTLMDAKDRLYQIKQDMINADRNSASSGWSCFYTPHPTHTKFIANVGALADEATEIVRTAIRKADLRNMALLLKRSIQSAEKKHLQVQDQVNTQNEAFRLQELRDKRDQDREDRLYQDKLDREDRDRKRDEDQRIYEAQQAQMLYERQLAAEQESRRLEAEDRAASAASAQAKIDAETQRQQMIFQAEERKLALEQERMLRTEEREIRKEEREAELQRLMRMQELASSGVPMSFAPAGAGYGPQLPGGLPMAVTGAVPAGYVPPGFAPAPGFQAQPGYPVAAGPPAPPPGYTSPAPQPYQQGMAPAFSAPQPYQQATAPAFPQGSPGPGQQWASFDPAAEMFGMGALQSTRNPNLTGAQIEEGYVIQGPFDNGTYKILYSGGQGMAPPQSPQGDVVYAALSEDALFRGALTDNVTGRVIFTPPTTRPEGVAPVVIQTVGQTLQTAIQAAGGYFQERERRKAAKYGPQYPQYGTDVRIGTGRGAPSSGSGPLLLIGALGLGAVVLAVAGGKKKKKGE